jgi:hypothetical protein
MNCDATREFSNSVDGNYKQFAPNNNRTGELQNAQDLFSKDLDAGNKM